MKNVLKLEELFMFALAVYLFTLTGFSWWLFAVFFLAPDIGMFGYIFSAKTGAVSYNILHHKGIAIALYFSGIILNIPVLMFTGIIMLAHSCFDRLLGYGLKSAIISKIRI
jgi:hypothetical protein